MTILLSITGHVCFFLSFVERSQYLIILRRGKNEKFEIEQDRNKFITHLTEENIEIKLQTDTFDWLFIDLYFIYRKFVYNNAILFY